VSAYPNGTYDLIDDDVRVPLADFERYVEDARKGREAQPADPLRDRIAMMVLTSMLPMRRDFMNRARVIEGMGREAYAIADAMLEARSEAPDMKEGE
jgi:hypothetical protein